MSEPSKPHDTGNITAVAIEMEPGWLYFRITSPNPEPSRIEFFLRRAIEEWFAERPIFVITQATMIINHGETLGIHVWYTEVESQSKPAMAASPVEFGIDVHGEVAAKHSKEYVEAVITDALKILPHYAHRNDTLLAVNRRRLAVILDKQRNRGKVIPVDFVEQVIEGAVKERLQSWLAAPDAPFYVMHIAGNWFSPKV